MFRLSSLFPKLLQTIIYVLLLNAVVADSRKLLTVEFFPAGF